MDDDEQQREKDKPHSTFTSKTTPTEGRPGFEDTVVTTTTTTTDPIAAAVELTETFRETTKAIKDLKKVPGRVRTLRVLMVLVLVAIAGLGVGGFAIYRVQQAGCEAGNRVRAGLLAMTDDFETAASRPPADGRVRTPEEIAFAEEFFANRRRDFALRGC